MQFAKTNGLPVGIFVAVMMVDMGIVPAQEMDPVFEPVITVTTTKDSRLSNETSLREAVIKANEQKGHQVIQLGRGTYSLTTSNRFGGTSEHWGDLVAKDPDGVTIVGQGPGRTRIRAEDIGDRVITFRQTEGEGMNLLEGVTVMGGVSGLEGGGIQNLASTLTIESCVIQGNTSRGKGGGVYNVGGRLTISNSSIVNNVASVGGGIYNRRTAFRDRASGKFVPVGGLTVTNSTIAKNSARREDGPFGQGGGVYLRGGQGVFVNVTIGRNQSGGIWHVPTWSALIDKEVFISNSLIAENKGLDLIGPITSRGHNLVSRTHLRTPLGRDDIVRGNTDRGYAGLPNTLKTVSGFPMLVPFPGSKAIDRGANHLTPDREGGDQRGQARIAGHAADIGAAEFSPLDMANVVIVDDQDPGFSTTPAGAWSTRVRDANGFRGKSRASTRLLPERSEALFRPKLPRAGTYSFYAWWSTGTTTNAQFDIYRNQDAYFNRDPQDGDTISGIDQRKQRGQWVLLGTFAFSEQDDIFVRLTHGSKLVSADAIMFRLESARFEAGRWSHVQRRWETNLTVGDVFKELQWNGCNPDKNGHLYERIPGDTETSKKKLRYKKSATALLPNMDYQFYVASACKVPGDSILLNSY